MAIPGRPQTAFVPRTPKGQPGNIPVGGGVTYNPVTQQYSGRVTGGNEDPPPPVDDDTGNGNNDTGNGNSNPGKMTDYEAWLVAEADRNRQAQRRETADAMKALFQQYGLETLWGKIVEYAQQDYSADTIALLLRQTPEYKARFPAMDALAKKGRAISEAAYVDYERTASALEQRYGFAKGMILSNVTDLLTNEVSANELNDRAVLASASSAEAPAELKRALKDYYNIDEGGLASYYFDPEKALPLLEKQYAVAAIGGEALKQGIGADRQTAEQLQAMGVTQAEARDRMDDAARAMTFTEGRGETLSQRDILTGTFGNEQAAQGIERVAGSRKGRFSGGGGYVSDSGGVSGLGSAGT